LDHTPTITSATNADSPSADNRIETYDYAVNGAVVASTQNSFDSFKRVEEKVYTVGNKEYAQKMYFDRSRVTSVRDTVANTTKMNYYYYDDCNRIVRVDMGGMTTAYHYDVYGQLVREDNQSLDMTMVYEYNNIGNLISAKKYSYTASTSSPSGTPVTTSFGYSNDKLTTFGGATIAYSSIGCPTTYEGKSLTWTKGKLSRMFSGTLATGTSSYNYTYNAFGQRVSRTYSYLPSNSSAVQIGQLTEYNKSYYYDHAGRLISENVSKAYYSAGSTSESIVFLYDESGIIGIARTVGSTTNAYYFQRNLLGDVVAIYDTSGNMVAKYLYDAWGNCTISSETTNYAVANANPIRYRGYYYDDDTGLYYCNARYYSPKWRRFISPDDTTYLNPKTVNGLNLYCYCYNDPINYIDFSGKFPIAIEAINTLISGALDLYEYLLEKSLDYLLNQPKMTMDVAKRLAREGGHIQSARAIMRSQQSTIALTRDSLETVRKAGKTLGKALLVADIAWSLGENLLSGEKSWLSDTVVDAGIAGAIYGLSFVPYVGFFLSLGATISTFVFEDEIDQFKDWFYEGWSEFWDFS